MTKPKTSRWYHQSARVSVSKNRSLYNRLRKVDTIVEYRRILDGSGHMNTCFTAPPDTDLPTNQFLINIQRFTKLVGMINKNELFEDDDVEYVIKLYFNHWLSRFVDENKSANYIGRVLVYEYLTDRHRKCKKEQSRRVIETGYVFKDVGGRIRVELDEIDEIFFS